MKNLNKRAEYFLQQAMAQLLLRPAGVSFQHDVNYSYLSKEERQTLFPEEHLLSLTNRVHLLYIFHSVQHTES